VLLLADAEAQAVLRGQPLGRDAAVAAGLPDPVKAAEDFKRKLVESATSLTTPSAPQPTLRPVSRDSPTRTTHRRPGTGGSSNSSAVLPGSKLSDTIITSRALPTESVALRLVNMKADLLRLSVLGTTLQSQYQCALECLTSASQMALNEFADVEHPFAVRIQTFVRLCNDRLKTFETGQRAAQLGEHHKLLEEWLVLQPGAKLANGDALRHRAMQKVFKLRNWS
jgi:hypothetical protein